MHYNQSCAAKGNTYGNRPLFIRSMQRAAVNVYKTDNSFEMLVFAPGRIKEHFHLDVNGNELTVSYTHQQAFHVLSGYCGNIAAVALKEHSR